MCPKIATQYSEYSVACTPDRPSNTRMKSEARISTLIFTTYVLLDLLVIQQSEAIDAYRIVCSSPEVPKLQQKLRD